MRKMWYLLDENNNIVPTDDMFAADKLLGDIDRRRVGLTEIYGTKISTVFLCVDHNFRLGQTPLLFETMISSCDGFDIPERYHNWEAAETGHDKWVENVKREKIQVLAMAEEITQNSGEN